MSCFFLGGGSNLRNLLYLCGLKLEQRNVGNVLTLTFLHWEVWVGWLGKLIEETHMQTFLKERASRGQGRGTRDRTWVWDVTWGASCCFFRLCCLFSLPAGYSENHGVLHKPVFTTVLSKNVSWGSHVRRHTEASLLRCTCKFQTTLLGQQHFDCTHLVAHIFGFSDDSCFVVFYSFEHFACKYAIALCCMQCLWR